MLENWYSMFQDCAPIGHHLRLAFPDRWVRFHSLPDSERYPESEDDTIELLTRHNSVINALCKKDEQVILLTTGYSRSPEPIRTYPELTNLDPQASFWRSVEMHRLDADFEEPTYWHLYASRHAWHYGMFDSVIRLVADYQVTDVLIVAPDCRWLVHPYDGGMDVIVDSQEVRDKLKANFQAWLSKHPRGL